MRKLKERNKRKRTLDTRIYPVVRIAAKSQRRPYIHVVEALTKSITSRQSSLFREYNHGHFDHAFH